MRNRGSVPIFPKTVDEESGVSIGRKQSIINIRTVKPRVVYRSITILEICLVLSSIGTVLWKVASSESIHDIHIERLAPLFVLVALLVHELLERGHITYIKCENNMLIFRKGAVTQYVLDPRHICEIRINRYWLTKYNNVTSRVRIVLEEKQDSCGVTMNVAVRTEEIVKCRHLQHVNVICRSSLADWKSMLFVITVLYMLICVAVCSL